jgi:hypothetical protein
MTVQRTSVALLAALATLLPATASDLTARQVPAQRPGAVSGVVVNGVTGEPVAGAGVTIRVLSGTGVSAPFPRMITDRHGRFVFPEVPPGDYFLDATRLGYAHTRYGWTAPNGSLALRDIARLTVTEGGWLGSIRVPLWQLGSIEGRVTDERDEPVVGTAVRVLSTRRVAGNEQLVAGPIATTDDRGVYRLADLDPGRYVVAALSVQQTVLDTTQESPSGRPQGELESGGIGAGRGAFVRGPTVDGSGRHRLALTYFATPPPPGSGEPRAYSATYYPGSATPAGATPLEIAYGTVRTGIDLRLVPVPTVQISGRADVQSGAPPPLLLRLMPAGTEQLGFGFEAATTVIEPDGRFTFLNVPEGSYTLLAQASVMDFTTGDASVRFDDAPGFPGGGISVGSTPGAPGLSYLSRMGQRSAYWGRMPVAAGRQSVDDLVLPLHSTSTLRGRIVLQEGASVPERGRVELMAVPASGDPTLGQVFGSTATNEQGRTFTIAGLVAGRYLVQNPDSLAVVSMLVDGRDVAASGVDIAAGRDIDDVVVTLTNRTATISGRVSGLNEQPSAVMVFPVDRARWTDFGWRPDRLRAVRSGTNGAYTIETLPAGDYFVVAVDAAQIHEWTNPRFLQAAALVATRTTIDWGSRTTVDLVFQKVAVR